MRQREVRVLRTTGAQLVMLVDVAVVVAVVAVWRGMARSGAIFIGCELITFRTQGIRIRRGIREFLGLWPTLGACNSLMAREGIAGIAGASSCGSAFIAFTGTCIAPAAPNCSHGRGSFVCVIKANILGFEIFVFFVVCCIYIYLLHVY